jgi:hypothetical protein
MEKVQSDAFETKLAQKLALATNLPKMSEAEEIKFYKNIIDATTDTVAEVMGGEAD